MAAVSGKGCVVNRSESDRRVDGACTAVSATPMARACAADLARALGGDSPSSSGPVPGTSHRLVRRGSVLAQRHRALVADRAGRRAELYRRARLVRAMRRRGAQAVRLDFRVGMAELNRVNPFVADPSWSGSWDSGDHFPPVVTVAANDEAALSDAGQEMGTASCERPKTKPCPPLNRTLAPWSIREAWQTRTHGHYHHP